ncbi:MAG: hypothetical protein ACE5HE_12675, partial [Phycisphaerae bacterium]
MVTTMVGRDGVRPVRVGMLLAVVSMLVGFGIGGAFGGFEHELEGYLKARGRGVADKVYHGRTADIKKAVKGGMKYLKRAHMHGGAIGAG